MHSGGRGFEPLHVHQKFHWEVAQWQSIRLLTGRLQVRVLPSQPVWSNMPRGLNRTDLNTTGVTYKDGTPVTVPKNFGTPIDTTTHNFGNPVTLPKDFGNPVTWAPNSNHFGNIIGGNPAATSGFLLEDSSGVILLEDGSILLLEVQ